MQRLHIAEQALHSLHIEENDLLHQLRSLSSSESTLDKAIFLTEQSLFDCIDDMNFVSVQAIQYAEMTLFFGKISKQFEYSDCSSRIALECLASVRTDLGHLFEKGAIAERCTRFIEGLTFRSNTLYNGEKLGRGEFLASLNRQYIAILSGSHTLLVYNTEGCVKDLGADTHTRIFCDKNGGLAVRRLMLLDSGVLEGSMGGEGDNAPVIIYTYHGGSNQKFVFERQPDLSYKITAVHSNKVLTLNAKNRVVQSSWENGAQQKWMIVGNDDRLVKLINVYSKKAIDIPMNSSDIRQNIWTYPDNGTTAQRFRLVRP